MPMSSPMMTTMFGRLPDAGGDAGCCACAGFVSPAPDSAEAATNEVPLNKQIAPFQRLRCLARRRSRTFYPLGPYS